MIIVRLVAAKHWRMRGGKNLGIRLKQPGLAWWVTKILATDSRHLATLQTGEWRVERGVLALHAAITGKQAPGAVWRLARPGWPNSELTGIRYFVFRQQKYAPSRLNFYGKYDPICCCIKFWSLQNETDFFNIFKTTVGGDNGTKVDPSQTELHFGRVCGCYFHAIEPLLIPPASPVHLEMKHDPLIHHNDTSIHCSSHGLPPWPGLLECGILYFSTYSKLCKTQYTHHTYAARYCLICRNNACLRPRNTE